MLDHTHTYIGSNKILVVTSHYNKLKNANKLTGQQLGLRLVCYLKIYILRILAIPQNSTHYAQNFSLKFDEKYFER